MDSFEFNKILASVLVSLIVIMGGSFLAEYLISPIPLEKPAIHIDVAASASTDSPTAPKELAPITPLLASANAANGQAIMQKRCTQCHTFDQGGANKIGPNIWGIFGAKITHLANYAYSKGLQALSGEKWDAESLNKFIHNPREFVKGTKMSFPGLANDQERADLIAHIKTLK